MDTLYTSSGQGGRGGATSAKRPTTAVAGGPRETERATEFLSLAEARRLLGVGRCRAWELARAGLLPAIRLGRRWYVPRRALDALADRALERREVALAQLDECARSAQDR